MKNQGEGDAKEGLIRNRESAREFVAIAVHDLREPLRAIRSSSELLATMCGDPAGESAARCLRFVQEGVDRMESLIRDISEYCYAEVRKMDLAEVDLEGALLEAKNQLAGQMQETHATLTLDPLPAVKGDFLALAMLFRCLIENACKFRGEAAPCIHVGAVQQGSEWILSVRDNGVGFAPEYRDRIFRPFERLNGKRYPGSGLGLPLAKRIVERHGGRMWAESKPGEGCVCWFSLPVG